MCDSEQSLGHLDTHDRVEKGVLQFFREPWDDFVFAHIERAGRVWLNASQRWRLQNYVELYQLLASHSIGRRGSSPRERKWLDTLIKRLNATLNSLDELQTTEEMVAMRVRLISNPRRLSGGFCLVDVIKGLKWLRKACVEERETMAQQGRKTDVCLDGLLGELEFLFLAAGGTSTRISRPGEARLGDSPFIDFVWAVVLQMPELIRPETQALAVRWERIKHRHGTAR